MARAHKITAANANKARWEKYHAEPGSWFWDRVDRTGGTDACWPWLGRVVKARRGYGRLVWNGRHIGAHRMALTLAKGEPFSPDMYACHRCDNPVCCNPDHLWWGTATDNMQDASTKGRMSSRAIIDTSRAYEMREAGLTLKEIGDFFGVHFASAGKAIKREAALRARASQ